MLACLCGGIVETGIIVATLSVVTSLFTYARNRWIVGKNERKPMYEK